MKVRVELPDEEVRFTSETGGEKGVKGARLGGADPLALIELAKVYGYGEQKYARYNYLKGYPWSLSVDALFRHLLAFLAGEERDQESGLLHTAHVAWHGLTLTSFLLRGVGTDDRVIQRSRGSRRAAKAGPAGTDPPLPDRPRPPSSGAPAHPQPSPARHGAGRASSPRCRSAGISHANRRHVITRRQYSLPKPVSRVTAG